MVQYNENYIMAFMEGYICATIGERFTAANVSELQLEAAKQAAEKCVEFQIDHSGLSNEEKNRIKNGYKLWADSTLQGMKRRLRESGRLL